MLGPLRRWRLARPARQYNAAGPPARDVRQCPPAALWRGTVCASVVLALAVAPTALASAQSTPSDWSSMAGPSWDAFSAEALRIYNENVALPPVTDATASPDDPSAELGPTATLQDEVAARARPMGGFAGAEQDDTTVFVGFTVDAGRKLAELRAAFPTADLRLYSARRTEQELDAIHDQIAVLAQASSDTGIVSIGGEHATDNAVQVGVRDLDSPEVAALSARFGDAVKIVHDEPPELLTATGSPGAVVPLAQPRSSRPVAPGRDEKKDPIIGGMHIYVRGLSRNCTSGFSYRGSLNPGPSSTEGGVITAGHCFDGQAPTTEWRQGQDVLGPFTRRRDVNNSRADAGTITTEMVEGGGFRAVSNEVFVAPDEPTIRVTRKRARNAGRKGDGLCISGAYGAFHCGTLINAGRRNNGRGIDYRLGRGVLLRNIYKARLGRGAGQQGDSGAPVLTRSGVALGIAFARNPKNPQVIYYAQIRNVEDELRVPVYLGR